MHEYVALRTRSHGVWGSAAAVAWAAAAAKGRAGGAPRRFDVMGRDVHDYLTSPGPGGRLLVPEKHAPRHPFIRFLFPPFLPPRHLASPALGVSAAY